MPYVGKARARARNLKAEGSGTTSLGEHHYSPRVVQVFMDTDCWIEKLAVSSGYVQNYSAQDGYQMIYRHDGNHEWTWIPNGGEK